MLKTRGKQGGFTLIEVLVAMLILAIGLLGLESLGIGAARSVNLASRQGDYATAASDTLESILAQLRRGVAVTDPAVGTLPAGDSMRVDVTLPAADSGFATVSVTVVPEPGSGMYSRADSVRLNGSIYYNRAP